MTIQQEVIVKFLFLFLSLPFLFSFTHPFAREGSVNNDSELLQRRIEQAEENREAHKKALELIEEEKQEQQEQEQGFQERKGDEQMNEAEKLVK